MGDTYNWKFKHARERLFLALGDLLPPHRKGLDDDIQAACGALLPTTFEEIDRSELTDDARRWLKDIEELAHKGMPANSQLSQDDQNRLSKAVLELFAYITRQ